MILNGVVEQAKIAHCLEERIKALKALYSLVPKLAVIVIGSRPASLLYVEKKQEFASRIGIQTEIFRLPAESSLEECLDLIQTLNHDDSVHGILLQLPVPVALDAQKLIETINPSKDVDGLHPLNMGKLVQGVDALYPCTPQGCLHLIHQWRSDLRGLVAVVVGRSTLVGKPIAAMLLKENVTVIQAHTHTKNLKDITRLADILVVATGHPNLIQADFIKEGACVIDVGISKNDQELTVGDVAFNAVKEKASAISPVPGGVGPMTISYLMINTLKSCCHFHKISWKNLLAL
ncbi:MAG: bifunctional 5,10-methylenetetrahydrofolate dehydrogenase/5,10-methenyltetrahydrofolate cyclohydrolase [Alphaproteobacteria bacterium]|nr:bifunctional 5,10-methylenetetrahydrofolate dehydrogenase/5,10-methenyltetrahydrofolate cyclohydrolase [Alphaproteobacteria bacterium]